LVPSKSFQLAKSLVTALADARLAPNVFAAEVDVSGMGATPYENNILASNVAPSSPRMSKVGIGS
jgi:hypothetical protein